MHAKIYWPPTLTGANLDCKMNFDESFILPNLFCLFALVWRIYLLTTYNQPLDIYPRISSGKTLQILRKIPSVDWPDGDATPSFTTIETSHWDTAPSQDVVPGDYFDLEVRFFDTEFRIYLNGEHVITHTEMHIVGKIVPAFFSFQFQQNHGTLLSCFFTISMSLHI